MTDKKQQRLNELEGIIVREQDMLFRFAYMRIGRREDAEDIVQDVFLKLFRSSESLRSVRNIKHYLTRSISNACKDFHGRQQNILQLEKAEREMVADESENVTIEIEDNGCLQQFSLHWSKQNTK